MKLQFFNFFRVFFFTIKNVFEIVWSRELLSCKALRQAHVLEALHICIKPLEYFLEAYEVKKFSKNKHKKPKKNAEMSKFLSNFDKLFNFIGLQKIF